MDKPKDAALVLVASADQRWRASCVEACLANGCDIHTASSGYQAIDDVRKHRYDLVVFDDSMADFSAFELHLNIRDRTATPPAELIAIGEAGRIAQGGRFSNGPNVHVGTPDEVRDRLSTEIRRVLAARN